MKHLLPCPGCARHVRAIDPLCPFCGAALPMSLRAATPRVPTKRLGRSATLAFGAALAASACGSSMSGDDDAGRVTLDSGSDEGDAGKLVDAGADSGQPVAMYGGPPADGGSD